MTIFGYSKKNSLLIHLDLFVSLIYEAFNKTPVLDIKPWLSSIDYPGGKINLDIEEKLGLKKKKSLSNSYPPIIEDETSFLSSRGWAEMIRKVYEVDPLLCPYCRGRMRIIAFIQEHAVIDKIINHLKLTFAAERPLPPQGAHHHLMMAAEFTSLF